MVLPKEFLERMKTEISKEYDAFVASYEKERAYGLRYNPIKAESKESFLSAMPFRLRKVKWAKEGFYYNYEERPGKHVLHEAGAYYIQEPSAMSAVEILNPKPGERVLDLCAAPGGKSTQIAGKLMGEGLLVSNEIVPDRARILSSNIERMGVRNAVVVSADPDALSERFTGFFDKVLVDAPCSGEGMFRKDETAIGEWSPENVSMCAKRQGKVLDAACKMLRAGGEMVYSTCTFSQEENEKNVEAFLERHSDFELVSQERFWPHKVEGEGHFVALLKRQDRGQSLCLTKDTGTVPVSFGTKGGKKQRNKNNACNTLKKPEIIDFLTREVGVKKEVVEQLLARGLIREFGENVYLVPEDFPDLSGINIVRAGLLLCQNLGKRLEPSHSFAMTLRLHEVEKCVVLGPQEAKRFINGETLNCDTSIKGWCTVFVCQDRGQFPCLAEDRGTVPVSCPASYSIGYGKAVNGILKNHYPKGLRHQ